MSKKRKPKPRPGRAPRLDSVYEGTVGDRYRVTADGMEIPGRQDLFNHSPDGFGWGYSGSGPAQLALALLADFLGNDELAVRLYQKFKFEVIAALPQESGWILTGRQIADSKTLREHFVEGIMES